MNCYCIRELIVLTGNEVPVFVWLLYARDTSDTPESFLLNHVNKIGDTGGMEQVVPLLLYLCV